MSRCGECKRGCGRGYEVLPARGGRLQGVVLGALLALAAADAHAAAADCEPVREVHPLPDRALPVDGSIWEICYHGSPGETPAEPGEVCSAPRLLDARGAAIELEVERRAEVPPTRWVTRYRPLSPLEVGATYTLEPGPFARPGAARSVRVVEATDALPERPVLIEVDYWVMGSEAEARVRFEAFQGLLVKDLGAQGMASLGAIDVAHVGWDGDPRPSLLLARNDCVDNFAAEPGASASIRFGVLDLAAHFSGWGEPLALKFPSTDTGSSGFALQPPSSDDPAAAGCALGAPAVTAASAWLGLVPLALALRRRRAARR